MACEKQSPSFAGAEIDKHRSAVVEGKLGEHRMEKADRGRLIPDGMFGGQAQLLNRHSSHRLDAGAPIEKRMPALKVARD
jgi:hypothetical protein